MVPAARRPESLPAVARPGAAVLRPGMGLALPSRLPFERWLNIGMQLSAASTSVAWSLGDWLAFGERAFAGRYRQAIEATCLDYQTLRNYAWVARRFGMSRRRDTLSFGHHAEVAGLPEAEQEYWLRKAEELGWSRNQIRHEVRASLRERNAGRPDSGELPAERPDDGSAVAALIAHEQAGHDAPASTACTLELNLTPEQLTQCSEAASREGLPVQDWALQVLRHAASSTGPALTIWPE